VALDWLVACKAATAVLPRSMLQYLLLLCTDSLRRSVALLEPSDHDVTALVVTVLARIVPAAGYLRAQSGPSAYLRSNRNDCSWFRPWGTTLHLRHWSCSWRGRMRMSAG